MTAVRAVAPPPAYLATGRRVLRAEAQAIAAVAERIGASFDAAVQAIRDCRGRIAVTGVGKSFDVARKIVSTFNSTGTRAYILDSTGAMHGDLGSIHPDDWALALSHSGESEELVRLLGPLKKLAAGVIGMTGNQNGTLARQADVALVYGDLSESCPLSLAPSTSTTVMMALGDALAFALSEARLFSAEDFARFHPSGSLGRKLSRVESVMRKHPDLRLAFDLETVRDVFAQSCRPGRRSGAIMLVDAGGTLTGVFTDSDLARLFERKKDASFDRPIRDVMTRNPKTISPAARVQEAVLLMRDCKISELPVVDDDGRPVGMLDVTDLIGFDPPAEQVTRPVVRLWEKPT